MKSFELMYSYPTVAQVTTGVVFGATDQLTGTGADAQALVDAQLATDVAAVTALKASVLTTASPLGVTGTYGVGATTNQTGMITLEQQLLDLKIAIIKGTHVWVDITSIEKRLNVLRAQLSVPNKPSVASDIADLAREITILAR